MALRLAGDVGLRYPGVTISPLTTSMLISSLARLRGTSPATCELGEVAWTSPMQEGAASESSPRNAHVVQGLGSDPLLQGLLADSKQHRAAALVLSTHDLHDPLVLDASGIGARRAKEIPIEVREVVVVALDALDQLPPAEPARAAGAYAALGAGDSGGRRVLADLAGGGHVPAGAKAAGEVHQVDAGAAAARHRPSRVLYMLDPVSVFARQGEASPCSGGWVHVGCARLLCGHEDVPSWSVPRGVSPPPGLPTL